MLREEFTAERPRSFLIQAHTKKRSCMLYGFFSLDTYDVPGIRPSLDPHFNVSPRLLLVLTPVPCMSP